MLKPRTRDFEKAAGEFMVVHGLTLSCRSYRPKDCIEVSLITQRLLLGPYNLGALLIKGLDYHHVTHVLTVANELADVPFPGRFDYLRIDLADEANAEIDQAIRVGVSFIKTHLSNPENVVLVHCYAGISRSSTVVIAYMMFEYGMSFANATEHVRRARHWIRPNPGFFRKLMDLSKALKTDHDSKHWEGYLTSFNILWDMHDKRSISPISKTFVEKAFASCFGKKHPNTLDVGRELSCFVSV